MVSADVTGDIDALIKDFVKNRSHMYSTHCTTIKTVTKQCPQSLDRLNDNFYFHPKGKINTFYLPIAYNLYFNILIYGIHAMHSLAL